MKVATLSKNWLFRAVALIFGIICCGSTYAAPVEVSCAWYDDGFEYEGMKFRFLCTYSEPLTLTLFDASEETEGDIILPEEFLINWAEASFPSIKAVIKRIDSNAFANSKAKSITLSSSITEIGDYAFYHYPMDKVSLNKGLLTIGSFAFSPAGKQLTFNIPESVITIGYGCFENCYFLNHIYLPSTLKALGGGVFRNCRDLVDIFCSAEIPPIADDSDFGREEIAYTPISGYAHHNRVPYNCVIHVPEESIELYKNAPGWNSFVNFVPLTEADIISSTLQIEESAVTPSQIDYTTDNGQLLVTVNPGDNVSVYDTNGLCLQKASYSSPDTFSFKGSGVVVLHVNENTVKLVL